MSVDPKKSADCRKGKSRSPWSWGPHVPRAKNFERNREFRRGQQGQQEQEKKGEQE